MDDFERDSETYWLKKAEQVRASAERMRHPETKSSLALITKAYERLAQHARERRQEGGRRW